MDHVAEFVASFRKYTTQLGSDPDVSDETYWNIVSLGIGKLLKS